MCSSPGNEEIFPSACISALTLSFHKIIYFERQNDWEGERHRGKNILLLLSYFRNDWSQKSGTPSGSFTWAAKIHSLEPISHVFPVYLAGSWSKVLRQEFQLSLLRDVGISGDSLASWAGPQSQALSSLLNDNCYWKSVHENQGRVRCFKAGVTQGGAKNITPFWKL